MIAPRRCRRSRRTAWAAFICRSLIRCRTCKAKGYVRTVEATAFGSVVSVLSCKACGGTGFAPLPIRPQP